MTLEMDISMMVGRILVLIQMMTSISLMGLTIQTIIQGHLTGVIKKTPTFEYLAIGWYSIDTVHSEQISGSEPVIPDSSRYMPLLKG